MKVDYINACCFGGANGDGKVYGNRQHGSRNPCSCQQEERRYLKRTSKSHSPKHIPLEVFMLSFNQEIQRIWYHPRFCSSGRSMQVAHLVVQIDPLPVLGERTRPCRKESPLAQRFRRLWSISAATVGWFEASDPITFHGHPKWCQGAAGAFAW